MSMSLTIHTLHALQKEIKIIQMKKKGNPYFKYVWLKQRYCTVKIKKKKRI